MPQHSLPKATLFLLSVFSLFATCIHAQQRKEGGITVSDHNRPGSFPLVKGGKAVAIFVDRKEEPVVRIAAKALKEDVETVTGAVPVLDSSGDVQAYSVIIGTIGKQPLIDGLVSNKKLDVSKVRGQWETFSVTVVDRPFPAVRQALVIAGSDARGTAYGVFELSKLMGVHPFHWWADIVPERKRELFVPKGTSLVGPPSVKYRGIFINDEDWGLQPWAAKTFEPETGDIGPKTYAKVFELLLRLKANLIWPAMHPGTKAFFHYPGNAKTAADYDIVIGSSHAEPMLRNNVGEWDEKTMGAFNYLTNKDKVYNYWEERVKQSGGINGMYTMGMRGVHDSKMEGVKDEKEAVPLLERIIDDQRNLLRRYRAKDVTDIPQVFTAYKEVLDIYDAGLKLPEDITLVWPDDNYGYIQRLNNDKERRRTGGAGVYYHASYWGRPHDYLWLSSTHPGLIREEMMKALATGANTLWVLNVGDIKPLEYNIEMFLDMGYGAMPFEDSRYVKTHLTHWAGTLFGKDKAQQIASLLLKYYALAFERRPEFMGWSQTEPTTKTALTGYNHFCYGDEAQRRIDAYDALQKESVALRSSISKNRRDAFYQLVYYPVVCASLLNKKFLYRDKAVLYAKQGRLSAGDCARLSQAAYDSIVAETDYYNTGLAGGKWKDMMSMKPRNLPVFAAPEVPDMTINESASWSLLPEGAGRSDSSLVNGPGASLLPEFDDVHKQQYFIDLFLSRKKNISWTATASSGWIKLSQSKGKLTPETAQTRIWVSIDWSKMPADSGAEGQIIFKDEEKQTVVTVQAHRLKIPSSAAYKPFVENNGFLSIHAADFSRRTEHPPFKWQVLEGLGYTGNVLQASLPAARENASADTAVNAGSGAGVEYDFYTFRAAPAEVSIFTLPTHPLNNKYSMRYALAIDDGPVETLDFRTVGRSEEWKQNVLRNRAERRISLPLLPAGKHVLKIFAVDPGVMLDEIRLDLGGLKHAYGMIRETK